MANIILPNGDSYYDRKRERKQFIENLKPHMFRAVSNSFDSDEERRKSTINERRFRIKMCVKLVKELAFERGWSFNKIKDNISYILKELIEGRDVDLCEFDDKKLWTPS